MTTAKPTQDDAWGEAWGEATRRLAAGEARLVGLWADGGRSAHGAVGGAAGTRVLPLRRCRRRVSLGRRGARAGDPPRARDRRPQRAEGAGRARRAALARPRPLAAQPSARVERAASGGEPERYAFLGAEGVGLHQIPVGPVHAGIIEPGHFRFHASGETIVRLEERLGYVHKGVERLMAGADLARGAELAGRVSGDSTVAYQIAFARAVEAAIGIVAPPRAAWLRALMAEIERVANHLGDIGAICNDASFALMHAHTGVLRELALRAADHAFGHRLMMDRVAPGGVRVDLDRDRRACLRELTATIRDTFPRLVELYDNTASLQDRTVGARAARSRAGAALRLRRRDRPRFGPRLRRAPRPCLFALRRAALRDAGLARGRRQRAGVGAHPRGRGILAADRADSRSAAGRSDPFASVSPPAGRARVGRWSKDSAATSSSTCASATTAESRAAICATRRGSSGRCSRRRSRATSSPTSRCATSRSIVPIPGYDL